MLYDSQTVSGTENHKDKVYRKIRYRLIPQFKYSKLQTINKENCALICYPDRGF